MSTPVPPEKPVTSERIPGTIVPDIHKALDAAGEEHGRRWMSAVAVSTAIMAAMAAISSSLSGGHLNEAMIDQIKASDQWAYYQAKGVKAAIVESRIEGAADTKREPSPEDVARLARYKGEQTEIKGMAELHAVQTAMHRRKYKTLANGATALQIGIGVAAVALLLRRNVFWFLALTAGAVGGVFLGIGVLGA